LLVGSVDDDCCMFNVMRRGARSTALNIHLYSDLNSEW
jgi:hypothetical protein